MPSDATAARPGGQRWNGTATTTGFGQWWAPPRQEGDPGGGWEREGVGVGGEGVRNAALYLWAPRARKYEISDPFPGGPGTRPTSDVHERQTFTSSNAPRRTGANGANVHPVKRPTSDAHE